MHKTFRIATLLLFSASLTFVGCGKKENISKSTGFKEIKTPCSGPDYRSNNKFFRADNSAQSMDLSTSREKALHNAKARLSSLINTKIKAVTDRYVNERDFGENSEFEQKFESMTREVVNQNLSDVRIICEKSGSLDNGKFQTFIALEVNKDDLFTGIQNGLSKDKKLQIDYDKMKYEKIFNEEMEKLSQEQGN